MRYLFLLTLSFFFAQTSFAQDSILFQNNWKKALALAKKEKKPIFLDAYTTWCGPCKRMESTTFKNKAVIKLLNEKFVPTHLNMEQGEGIALASQYKIGGYPTFLFVDAEGRVLHSDAGFKDDVMLIEMCNLALDDKENLAALDAKFQAEKLDKEQLRKYIDKRAILMNASNDAAIEAYLKLLPNWTEPDAMDFIINYVSNPGSLGFLYLLENKSKFIEKYSANRVNQITESVVYQELTGGRHKAGIEPMQKVFKLMFPEEVAAKYDAKYQTVYYQATRDGDKYFKACEAYTKQFPPEDPAEWADLAVGASMISKNKAQLSTMMDWLDKSLKVEETFECHLAKAYLLKAMGKKKKAKKQAEKTIAWAKEKEEGFAPATQFLSTL